MIEYVFHLLIMIGIYLPLALALHVNIEKSGLINLGVIGLWGLSSYTTAIMLNLHDSWLLAALASLLIVICLSAFVALVTRKLKDDYFALATLSLQFIIYVVISQSRGLTQGGHGYNVNITNTMALSSGGIITFAGQLWLAVCIMLVGLYLFDKSSQACMMRAMKDNEVKLQAIGYSTTAIRVISLVLAGMLCAVSGSYYAMYIGYLHPSQFTMEEVVLVLFMFFLGGGRNISTIVAGTVTVVVFPELLRFLHVSNVNIGAVRQIFYALLLLVSMYVSLKRRILGDKGS